MHQPQRGCVRVGAILPATDSRDYAPAGHNPVGVGRVGWGCLPGVAACRRNPGLGDGIPLGFHTSPRCARRLKSPPREHGWPAAPTAFPHNPEPITNNLSRADGCAARRPFVIGGFGWRAHRPAGSPHRPTVLARAPGGKCRRAQLLRVSAPPARTSHAGKLLFSADFVDRSALN